LRQTDFHYFSRPVLISLAYGKVFSNMRFPMRLFSAQLFSFKSGSIPIFSGKAP